MQVKILKITISINITHTNIIKDTIDIITEDVSSEPFDEIPDNCIIPAPAIIRGESQKKSVIFISLLILGRSAISIAAVIKNEKNIFTKKNL